MKRGLLLLFPLHYFAEQEVFEPVTGCMVGDFCWCHSRVAAYWKLEDPCCRFMVLPMAVILVFLWRYVGHTLRAGKIINSTVKPFQPGGDTGEPRFNNLDRLKMLKDTNVDNTLKRSLYRITWLSSIQVGLHLRLHKPYPWRVPLKY